LPSLWPQKAAFNIPAWGILAGCPVRAITGPAKGTGK
jgi:hypothetical protein